MANVTDGDPAGTVAPAGTTTLVELELRVTLQPPAGAGSFRVNVPVEPMPPITVDGDNVKPLRAGGVMVRTAVTALPLNDALIVAGVDV